MIANRGYGLAVGFFVWLMRSSRNFGFYLMSRGMTEDEAMATIVRGFVEPIKITMDGISQVALG